MYQRKGGNGAGQECSLAVIGAFTVVIGRMQLKVR